MGKFNCPRLAFQVIAESDPSNNPYNSQFRSINPVTGAVTVISPDMGGVINAIAYNITDDYIYGIYDMNDPLAGHMAKIEDDGTVTDMGLIPNLPTNNITNGAFDDNGYYYIAGNGQEEFYVLDMRSTSPNFGLIVDPRNNYLLSTAGNEAVPLTGIGNISGDWVFNKADGLLYATAKDLAPTPVFVTINPTIPSFSTLITPSTIPVGGGAAFIDANGFIFFIHNSTGTIVRWRNDNGTMVGEIFSYSELPKRQDATLCLNAEILVDFGDAPDTNSASQGTGNYRTKLASDGPRHLIHPNLKLGRDITAETDAYQSSDASGDDIPSQTPDDGISTSLPDLQPNDTTYSFSVLYTNNTGSSANIYAWVDFDQDGEFEGDSVLVQNVSTSSSNPRSTNFNFTIPPSASLTASTTFARIRITTDTLVNQNVLAIDEDTRSYGPASDGEVEDYLINITDPSAKFDGTIFFDLNVDGIFDVGEPPISSSAVILYDQTNNTCQTTYSDSNGYYDFDVTTPGEYIIYETATANLNCPPTNFAQPSGYTNSTTPRQFWLTVTSTDINNSTVFTNNFGHDTNSDSLECSSTAIQFAGNPSEWFDINLITGVSTSKGILNSNTHINAIGFNPLDGYIYGFDNTNSVIARIDNNKNVAQFNPLPIGLPSLGYNTGAIDENGYYYLTTSGISTIYVIDLKQNSSTFMKLVDPSNNYAEEFSNYGINIGSISGIPDFTYNKVSKLLYGVNSSGNVVTIDPLTSIKQTLITTTSIAGAYGAAFSDSSEFFYAIRNENGNIYRFTINGSNAISEPFSNSAASGINDGAMCINSQINVDFGDAPDTSSSNGADNYSTLLANNGPRHAIVNELFLGSNITSETNAYQNSDATGDDITLNVPDDGITSPLSPVFTADSTYTLSVLATNNTGIDATVYAWIDFNKSGTFDGNEFATGTISSNSSNPRIVNLNFNIANQLIPDHTFVRVRLTTQTLTNTNSANSSLEDTRSLGPAYDGEIEDYYLEILNSSTKLNGKIFYDANQDGILDNSEVGIPNAFIVLYDVANGTCISEQSDANGDYEFEVDTAGDYVLYETAITPGNNCPPDLFGQPSGYTNSTTSRTRFITVTPADLASQNDIVNNFGHNNSTDTFPCKPTSYQFASSPVTEVFEINPVTGAVTPLYTLDRQINAVGFNPLDNFIYGIEDVGLPSLIRVDASGNTYNLGVIDNLANNGGYITGAFDDLGHYFFINPGDPEFYVLDLNPLSAYYLQLVDPTNNYDIELSTFGTTLSMTTLAQDWIFNINDGNLYGGARNTGVIERVIPTTGQATNLTTTGLPTGESFGAAFSFTIDDMFIISNDTGIVYRILINGNNATAENFTQTGIFSTNDGTSCINAVIELDFGDAPDIDPLTQGEDNYRTLLESDGPRHQIINNLMLGSRVSAEKDAYQNSDATGDDLILNVPDDGIITPLTALYNTDDTYSVDVLYTNDTGLDANIYGWLDFNKNGTFDENESAFVVVSSNSTNPRIATLTFTKPVGSVVTEDHTFIRLRITTDNLINANTDPTTEDTRSYGPASDGEVEDYYLEVKLSTVTFCGYVFEDLNLSGTYDIGEPGIPNVFVVLYDFVNVICYETQTDALGFYSFEISEVGEYLICETAGNPLASCPPTPFTQPTGFELSTTPREIYMPVTNTDLANGEVFCDKHFGHIKPAKKIPCDACAFLITGGDCPDLIQYNIISASIDKKIQLRPVQDINAIGYSKLDNYIYGFSNTNGFLVRLDYDGNITNLSSTNAIFPLTTPYFTIGDISADGYYYLYETNSLEFYTVDLRQNNVNFLQLLDPTNSYVSTTTGTTIIGGGLPIEDWGVSPIDGNFYSIDITNGDIIILDPTTASVTRIVPTPSIIGNFQSILIDSNGHIFALDGTNGDIYRYIITGGTAISAHISNTFPNLFLDGAICSDASLLLDFGDAPDIDATNGTDNYSTLLSNNGPRHARKNTLRLGSLITEEADGYQNTDATGDDLINGIQDDGVNIPLTSLPSGATEYLLNVSYLNNTGETAYIYSWIDFNSNGIFELSEGVITPVPSSNDPNPKDINILIPNTSFECFKEDCTFARVRITTDILINENGLLSEEDTRSLGGASDGEVEDYKIDIEYYAVQGTIWHDADKDGLLNSEPLLENITIELYSNEIPNTAVEFTITDINGFYSFDTLPQGDYFIKVNSPKNFNFTTYNVSSGSFQNSDILTPNNNSVLFTLDTSNPLQVVDGGIFPYMTYSISGFAFFDCKENSIYDNCDFLFNNVSISLYSSNASLLQTTITGAKSKGYYEFKNVEPGTYILHVTAINALNLTVPDTSYYASRFSQTTFTAVVTIVTSSIDNINVGFIGTLEDKIKYCFKDMTTCECNSCSSCSSCSSCNSCGCSSGSCC